MNTDQNIKILDENLIKERWDAFKSNHPHARLSDGAKELDVSELELVVAGCAGPATHLGVRPEVIFKELCKIGEVMALTRNEFAVIEKDGHYINVTTSPHMGLVVNKDIDLRLFFSHWQHIWAVERSSKHGRLFSLEFYDSTGQALHKVFLRPNSNLKAYQKLVDTYRSPKPPVLQLKQVQTKTMLQISPFTSEKLRKDWMALKDTHEFIKLLNKHKIDRHQALEIVGSDLALSVDPQCVPKALEMARDQEIPIMVFVGNHGAIEIHSGPIKSLKQVGSWFNILDPGFNLHLNLEGIASCWIVRKPIVEKTGKGIVTSVEFYAANGFLIGQIFGVRKPGVPERLDWQLLVDQLRQYGRS